MHPAYSIIFFTVSSGMGYGLLIAACLMTLSGRLDAQNASGLLVFGMLLVIAGLLSSTFHLGHPERAWRAFSQWRTSWLSREGVCAVLSLLATTGLILMYQLNLFHASGEILVIILAVATVLCTAMIYASLRPIPRWHHPLVPVLYLLFSLSSGGLLLLTVQAVFADTWVNAFWMIGLLTAVTWLIKWFYWRHSDAQALTSTTQSATGLGHFMGESTSKSMNKSTSDPAKLATVTVLDVPNTSKNYVQKEMGFTIARRHRNKLRRIALTSGSLSALLVLGLATGTSSPFQTLVIIMAMAFSTLALIVERWLFFAEAQHVVTLFYGE